MLAKIGSALFDLTPVGIGRCLCWRPDSVAGEVTGPQGAIQRILKLSDGALSIYDCVAPGAELADLPPMIPMSTGYGRR